MNKIVDRLNNAIKISNLSYAELEKRTKISKSALQRYASGQTKKIPLDVITSIAPILGVTPAYLMGWEENSDENIYTASNISFIKVPLYGDISCGNGAFVDDNIVDYVAVPNDNLNPKSEYFAQRAKGDSMINAGIDDGDIIVFEKVSTIDDNKIGCFCIDESMATCKRFKRGSSYIQLIPANQNYDPIVVDLESTNFRILGKLRKVIKEFD